MNIELPPDFRAPSASSRPKIRWWWPDPVAVDDERLRADVRAMVDAGFGGIEIAWLQAVEGWGSAEWRGHVRHALEEAQAAGIRLDLTLGPCWPLSSPSMTESLSQHELLYASEQVEGLVTFSGPVPAPERVGGAVRLVATTAARVAPDADGRGSIVLDPESTVDLTQAVDGDQLHWDVPAGQWLVFGFWERATAQLVPASWPHPSIEERLARQPESRPTTWLTVDHFGEESLRTWLAFMDESLVADGLGELLRTAASNVFEDSLELHATLLWTTDFLREFAQRRGYELARHLPALFVPGIHEMAGSLGPLPPPTFELVGGVGERARYDFDETLTDLYVERHLRPMVAWAEARGVSLRAQVAYNVTSLGIVRSAASVPVPEVETFGLGDPAPPGSPEAQYALDAYRAMSAGAHLSGARQVSTELGDVVGAVYGQNPLEYKDLINRSYACGVTQIVIHGYAHSDDAHPWPGWNPFMLISEPWGRQHPQWRDWPELTTYMGRANTVLEHGTPTVDVAIYYDGGLDPARETTVPGSAAMHPEGLPEFEARALFKDTGMQRAGYTYEYIDAHGLVSTGADRVPGQLHGEGPAYRALILNEQQALRVTTAHAILAHARQGLPVVIIGAPPHRGAGLQDADSEVIHAMTELEELANVGHAATEAGVSATLRRLGVQAAAAFPEPLPLLTTRRRTATSDCWYVFNLSDAPVSAPVTFATAGEPAMLDLWNGTVEPLGQYRVLDDGVEVPIALPPLGDTVLAFQRGEARHHAESSDAEQIVVEGRSLVVRDTRGGRRTVHLGDGRTVDVELGEPGASQQLDEWRLRVEEVLPSGRAVHEVTLDALEDWRLIDALKDASGIGRYTTSVALPEAAVAPDRGIFLDVGDVKGSMRVSVNGTRITQQIVPGGRWAIEHLLGPGENEIAIEVATTLRNRVVAVAADDDPRYAAVKSLPTLPSGLLGPVRLISFGKASLA
jgi:hypothetical protein